MVTKTFRLQMLLAMVVSLPMLLSAQTPLTQQIEFRVSEDGTAAVKQSMKMNAEQWSNYRSSNSATSLSVRKRDMERMMPAYLIENFKYSEDDLERKALFEFDLYGLCRYLGKNQWRIRLEAKDPQVEKISNSMFMMTSQLTQEEGGANQVIRLHLPESASDAKVEKDVLGYAEIRFRMPTEGGILMSWLSLGMLFLISGAGWMAWQRFGRTAKG